MKKTVTLTAIALLPLALSAQDIYQLPSGRSLSRQFFEVPAMILGFSLMGFFILTILRWLLDFRLKSKLINKELREDVLKQFLGPQSSDNKSQAMKWFLVLAGLGVGLAFVSLTEPVGLHSLAIMVSSVALSFLGYFYYIRKSEKNTDHEKH